MIEIGVVSQRITQNLGYGAVEHYRNLGVYHHMQKVMKKPIYFHELRQMQVKDFNHMDILHVQNPCTPQHVQQMQVTKSLGIKIIADFDDDLQDISWNNHNKARLMQAADYMKEALKFADVVTCSTNFLAKKLKPYCDPIVIPNSWYKQRQPVASVAPNVMIFWRGSRSHGDDAAEFQNEVMELMDKSGKVPLVLWTDKVMSEWTHGYKNRAQDPDGKWVCKEPIEVLQYFQQMAHDVRPMLTLVPLYDCDFNRCKSNIAWLETTLAGGVAVVPDWEEWRNAGALKYKSRKDFVKQAMAVINQEVDVTKKNKASMQVIEEKYNLDKNNLERWKIVDSLT